MDRKSVLHRRAIDPARQFIVHATQGLKEFIDTQHGVETVRVDGDSVGDVDDDADPDFGIFPGYKLRQLPVKPE